MVKILANLTNLLLSHNLGKTHLEQHEAILVSFIPIGGMTMATYLLKQMTTVIMHTMITIAEIPTVMKIHLRLSVMKKKFQRGIK